MDNISSFLSKFKSLLNKDVVIKEEVAEAVSRVLKIKLDPSKVKIKDSVAYIQASPLVKNEILINKKDILKDLESSVLKDIR